MNCPQFLKPGQLFRGSEDFWGLDLQLLSACQPGLKANAKRAFGCLHRSHWKPSTKGKDLFSSLVRLAKRGSWPGPSVLPGSRMFRPDLDPIDRVALVLLGRTRMVRRGKCCISTSKP